LRIKKEVRKDWVNEATYIVGGKRGLSGRACESGATPIRLEQKDERHKGGLKRLFGVPYVHGGKKELSGKARESGDMLVGPEHEDKRPFIFSSGL
jgi:hypothetical protein